MCVDKALAPRKPLPWRWARQQGSVTDCAAAEEGGGRESQGPGPDPLEQRTLELGVKGKRVKQRGWGMSKVEEMGTTVLPGAVEWSDGRGGSKQNEQRSYCM